MAPPAAWQHHSVLGLTGRIESRVRINEEDG